MPDHEIYLVNPAGSRNSARADIGVHKFILTAHGHVLNGRALSPEEHNVAAEALSTVRLRGGRRRVYTKIVVPVDTAVPAPKNKGGRPRKPQPEEPEEAVPPITADPNTWPGGDAVDDLPPADESEAPPDQNLSGSCGWQIPPPPAMKSPKPEERPKVSAAGKILEELGF